MKFIDVSGVEFACEVIFTGNITQTGNQTITGDLTASGTVEAEDLIINNDATIDGNLEIVNGNVTISAGDLTLTIGDQRITAGDLDVVAGDINCGGSILVANTFTAQGDFDISGATITGLPSSYNFGRYWVSGAITSLTGGQSSQSVAVPTGTMGAQPTANVPYAAYLVTSGSQITSSNGNTTALTAQLGISGTTSGYLQAGANLIGATVGRQQNAASLLLGTFRATDALLVTFTATGGAPDLAHIQNLSMRVVVYYHDPIAGS